MRLILLCLFWLASVSIAFAQPIPLPLPKVTKAFLAEKSYADFPDAEAVIVQDYGDLNYVVLGGKLKLFYRYLRQIKVLKQSNSRWTELKIPYSEDERLVDVLAMTYTLPDEGGKMVRVKLEKSAISDRSLGEGQFVRIIKLPKLRPGAVITYRYTVQTEEYGRLRPWQFQYDIPVLNSQYVTRIPAEFDYLVLFQGDQHNLERGSQSTPQTQRFRFTPRAGDYPKVYPRSGGASMKFLLEETYFMKNIPAFQEEPLMASPSTYLMRLRFQLHGVEGLDKDESQIVQNWKDVHGRMRVHPQFGRQLIKQADWRTEVSSMLTSRPEGRNKIEAIFEKVRERTRWSGIYALFTERDLADVYQQKVGNSAEINLLLTAILASEGFKAYPVLVSTRDHGTINELLPVIDQFNHVIAAVDYRGERILMDATQAFVPMGMLPFNVINGQGLRIGEKKANFIPLRAQHARHRRTYARFIMDKSGKLEGKIRHLDKGYSASRTRALLASYDQQVEDFFQDQMIAEFSDIELEGFNVTDQHLIGEPVSTRAEFNTTDFVTVTPDLVLLDPLLSEGYNDNPFSRNERKYPIDFGVPIVEQYLLVLTLPEGYDFDVVPDEIRVVLPRNAGMFSYQTLIVQDRHIQILSKIEINKTTFNPGEYAAIRSFFDHIVAKHTEKLVIKKVKKG